MLFSVDFFLFLETAGNPNFVGSLLDKAGIHFVLIMQGFAEGKKIAITFVNDRTMLPYRACTAKVVA